jgi:hypothetical protein
MGAMLPFRRFNSQPTSLDGVVLNPKHPAIKELQVATFATDSATFFNVAQGVPFNDPYPELSFTRQSITAQGRARATHGGAYRNELTPASVTPRSALKVSTARGKLTTLIFIRPKIASGASAVGTILAAGEALGNWDMTQISWGPNNNISAKCVNGTTITSDAPLTLGGYYAIAFVNDGPNSSQRLYINGVKQSGTSSYGGNAGKQLDNFVLGVTNQDDSIDVFAAFAWSDVLNDATIADLSRNPYPLLAKQRSASAKLSAASVVVRHTLAGANGLQINVCTTAAIVQHYQLTLAACTQGNVSSSGSLVQHYRLTSSGMQQVNASATGAVSERHKPVAASIAQVNVVTVGATSQRHILAGSASAQQSASSTSTVAQHHKLTGQASSQLNVTSLGTIGGLRHNLSAVGGMQGNGVATGAVSQHFKLTAAGCGQQNTCTAGAAGQHHRLIAAAVSQNNVSPLVTLGLTRQTLSASLPDMQFNASPAGVVTQHYKLGGTNGLQRGSVSVASIVLHHALSALAATQINLAPAGLVNTRHALGINSCIQVNLSSIGRIPLSQEAALKMRHFPLMGLTQTYPLVGQKQHYPLEGK